MFRNPIMQRGIAAVVLATFTSLTMAPVVAAAQTPGAPSSSADWIASSFVPLEPSDTWERGSDALLPRDPRTLPSGKQKNSGQQTNSKLPGTPSTEGYTRALQRLHELIQQAQSGTVGDHVQSIRSQYRAVEQHQNQATAAFAATEAHIRNKGLHPEILQRHQAAVEEHAHRKAELRAAVDGLGSAEAGASLKKLRHIMRERTSDTRNPDDGAKRLPWGGKKTVPRIPAATSRAHERLFPRTVQVAAAGSLSGIALPDAILGEAVQPEDLAETEEVQLTPEIRALAVELSNNPVRIYNWVRNNVQFVPGYGAMQGAAGAFASRRGNAFDTASLLIALYRAAGIPARYVYGTIEVPTARAQDWLRVDSMAAVQSLLTQSGIPNRAAVAGGQVKAVHMEHVWVEAFVDYAPSRGAANKAPDTWVPLDASFKQMQDKAGLDLRGAVTLNEAAVLDAARLGASCTADFAANLHSANLQAAYDAYAAQLSTYLDQQGSALVTGDVLGSQVIGAENYSILLGSLPYKTIARGAVVNVLPEHLRWKFRFQLYAGAAEQGQDQATAAFTASLAGLAGKRVTLSFTPATQADADALASYMPAAPADGSAVQPNAFPADIPGYLIHVKAELRVDGVLRASGGSFVLGSALLADTALFDPASSEWNNQTDSLHAGDYQALAIDAQGTSTAALSAAKNRLATTMDKLSNGQAGDLARDDVAGDTLYQNALAYFAVADANAAVFQRIAGVVEQRLPSYGRAIAKVKPHLMLGIVGKVSFPGVTLDIDTMQSAIATLGSGMDAATYVRQSNQRNAAYAHLVLQKLYTHAQQPGEAVSAIRALAVAATKGSPVYAVNAQNAASVLPLIYASDGVKAEVRNAAAAGLRVLVAQNPVMAGAWSGHALLVEDHSTGAGAYRLHDEDGSMTAALVAAGGMGWLALAQPFQSAAAVIPVMRAAQASNDVLASMLDASADTVRWQYFAGQDGVANGLFLARLSTVRDSTVCDSLTGVLAASLGVATGPAGADLIVVSPPVINSNPITSATAGQAYEYPIAATDPQGLPLNYRLVQPPAGMHIDASGLVRWDKPVAGSVAVTVQADNGKAYAEQRYVLVVGAEALPLEINLSVAPASINAGETVTITALTNGGTGPVTVALTINDRPVALNSAGQVSIADAAIGAHRILVSATDRLGTITRTGLFSVRDPADTTAPLAEITAPGNDAEITAPVNVIGTASDANLAYYRLLLRPAGASGWREIARSTHSVTNDVLGKLDPTQLLNGIYELALNVVDINGRQSSQLTTIDIYRDLKIGQFSISFEDLNIDASGIPIRVTRTYDTRRKGESLDFGRGWSVDYQSMQIRKNMAVGLQWDIFSKQLQLCMRPAGKRKINITLPSGKVERFTAANAQECALAQLPPLDIRFTPLPGTTSRLEATNIPVLMVYGGIYDMDNFEYWNPKDFKLTTEDNYVFFLKEGVGIVQVKDPSGNTLTYGQNGILHSNGQSISFTRDAAKRITAITDPAGKKITYTYDASGDLTRVTDRNDAVSTFRYNRSHGLVDYTDPTGTVTARYVYDDDGRLIAAYDAEGQAIEVTHDIDNNRQVVKDRRGNATTYVYDAAGNVTEVTDALGNKTTYTYDANGNETSVTDAAGNTILRTFHAQSGKQLTEQDPIGHSTAWGYNINNQLQNTTDARGYVTQFVHAPNGGKTIQEPLGRTSALTLDGKGNLRTMTVAGVATTYTYDTKGNKLTETDAAGNVTSYTYDANNRETSRSWTHTAIVNGTAQQNTVTVTRKLDAEGRVLEETDALGATTKTEYNAGGQVTATIDPQGRKTGYEYNSRGQLARTVHPDGGSESHGYDAEGNRTSSTDRQGRTTRYDYDALNRLVKTTYPDGSSSATEYDAVGRIAATIDARGNRTQNTYDAAGRLIRVTDAHGNATEFGYDANGNRTRITDAAGQITRFEYDALNRLIKTTTPDGNSATLVWNVNGTKQSETDAAGNQTEYGYDAVGRLNQVRQTDGVTRQVTVYGYDNNGNKTSQTDAEGRITRWEYDAAGRVSARTLPAGQRESFSYDAVGNMVAKTDFNGQTTSYGYDSLGQLTGVVRPDGVTLIHTYTPSGQLASTTVGGQDGVQTGKTSYQYDANDRLIKQTNPDGSFLAYGYDADGNITQRSTRAGTVTYGYDANQRLASVTDIDGQATSYSYDATGRMATATAPNGVVTTYTHDANGRLLQVLHRKADGSIVTGTRYTLTDNGQRTQAEEFDTQSSITENEPANPARSSSYSYDSTGRLIQEQVTHRDGTTRTIGYVYDKAGNRKQKSETTAAGTDTTTYVYDANDRLTQETRTTTTGSQIETVYAWDANGNLKSKTTGSATTYYTWSADNRLIEVRQGTSEATAQTIAKYRYDADGNRTHRIEPGQNGAPDKVTTYLTDNSFEYAQVVQEATAQGQDTASTRYVWGANLIRQQMGGQSAFYHADGLGSVKALTDAGGNVADAYAYDAFGELKSKSGAAENAYRYTGEYFDEALQLQYSRARWYDANAGRFVSMDEWNGAPSQPITLNKYTYANSDPINFTDPSGHLSLGSIGVAGAVSGILTTISVASTVWSAYEFATGERELTAQELGIAALMLFGGPVAGKLITMVLRTSVNKTLLAAISAGAFPKILVKGGRVRQADLKNMVPPGTPNTFKPSANIKSGEKYQFEIDGVKMEVKWHAPDAGAAAKFPSSNSGTMWTAQIKADGKLVGLDGKMYSKPNNFTHIPIDF